EHAADLVLVTQQARQLRSQAVAQQEERTTRQRRVGVVDHGFVVARPVEQIGLEAAQRAAARTRLAAAAVVEREHAPAAARQPLGKWRVVVLPHAHRTADDHAAQARAIGLVNPRGQLHAVGRLDRLRLHVLFSSSKDNSAPVGLSSRQILSNIPAAPCPMPTHMVTMPYLRFLRRRACTTVADRIAPVAPSGWPSAIAPPMGLTLLASRPSVSMTASDCAANASLSSIQSRSSCLSPA